MCYSPASYANAGDLQKKAQLFKDRKGTVSRFMKTPYGQHSASDTFLTQTHWPHANIYRDERKVIRLGQEETYKRDRPVSEPVETDKLLKLAGVVPYGL